jgi:chemotaxis protein CheD
MSNLVVGVADCKTSRDPQTVLITYGLGSCISLALHDPISKIGGLLHYMLPESRIDREKARRNPFMFADTGIPHLLREICRLGTRPERLSVRAAGGAQVFEAAGHFDIGKRNHVALRKVLWKVGLMIHAENVGGRVSRTVSLDVSSGQFLWRGSNGKQGELAPNAGRRGSASGSRMLAGHRSRGS